MLIYALRLRGNQAPIKARQLTVNLLPDMTSKSRIWNIFLVRNFVD